MTALVPRINVALKSRGDRKNRVTLLITIIPQMLPTILQAMLPSLTICLPCNRHPALFLAHRRSHSLARLLKKNVLSLWIMLLLLAQLPLPRNQNELPGRWRLMRTMMIVEKMRKRVESLLTVLALDLRRVMLKLQPPRMLVSMEFQALSQKLSKSWIFQHNDLKSISCVQSIFSLLGLYVYHSEVRFLCLIEDTGVLLNGVNGLLATKSTENDIHSNYNFLSYSNNFIKSIFDLEHTGFQLLYRDILTEIVIFQLPSIFPSHLNFSVTPRWTR